MGMNMQEFSISFNIFNILKDCQRICGDFIFTVVFCVWNLTFHITSIQLLGFT